MHRILFFILLTGLSVTTVFAQQNITLSFEEAIQMALNQNIDLQIIRNQLEVNKALHTEAKLMHLPSLGLNSSAQRQIGQQFQLVEGNIEITNIATDYLTAGFNANMDIFTGMSRTQNFLATTKRVEAQKEQIRQSEQQVIRDVARQYLQILLDKSLLAIAKENLENQQKQMKQMEGFVASGIRARAELLSQQAEVARIELQLVEAEIQLEKDLQELAFSLQLSTGYSLDVQDARPEGDLISYQAYEVEDLFAVALQKRPDYRQQQAVEEASFREWKASKSAYLPQVSAFYNYNSYYTSLDDRALTTQFRDIYPTNTFGFRMQLPLFQRYSNRVNEVRSSIAAKNEALNNESLKRQIYREVQVAHLDYKGASKREEAARKQYDASETNFRVQQERYNLGLGSFVDFAEANRLLVQARYDLSQAAYTRQFNALILSYTIGDFTVVD